jgi:curved DNA-binding protein CbpA
MSDHYNLLGVPPQASAAELRKAFRREAKRCHPDALAGRPEAEREAARLRFIRLAQAYQVLSDPQRRRAYDRSLPARPAPQNATRNASATGPGTARPAGQASPRAAAGSSGPAGPAGPGAQRAGSAPGSTPRRAPARASPGPTGPAPELRDILKEAEQSLSRFGLDSRPPAEVAVEELLDWAKALYRDLVGAVTGSTAAAAPDAGTGAPGSGAPWTGSSRTMAREAGAQPAPGAGYSELSVERELEQIKRRIQGGVRGGAQRGRAPGSGTARAPTVDDELADLKRRHGKKR